SPNGSTRFCSGMLNLDCNDATAVDHGKPLTRQAFSAPTRGHRLLPPLYCGSSMRTPAELIPTRSLSLEAFDLTDRVAILTRGNRRPLPAMAAGLAPPRAAIALAGPDPAQRPRAAQPP